MIVALLLSLAAAPAPAMAGARHVEHPCHADALIKNPAGALVYATPKQSGRPIANIPFMETRVTVSGAKGEWFRIRRVVDMEKTLLRGRGWIHHSQLDIGMSNDEGRGHPLRSSPRRDAPEIGRITTEAAKVEGIDEIAADVVDCHDDWLKVRFQNIEGWLEPGAGCANPVTTCP